MKTFYIEITLDKTAPGPFTMEAVEKDGVEN